jgi:hypothetical protein
MSPYPSPTSPFEAPRRLPVLSQAVVQVTSEAVGHPISLVFDETHEPGAFHWRAAEPGDQTLTVSFYQPSTIDRVIMDIEECDETRTQEVQLASSNDGGITFRELVRQEFNFSPGGATWEHEDWTVRQKDVTHIRLMIKPDKRRTDLFATLASFVLLVHQPTQGIESTEGSR